MEFHFVYLVKFRRVKFDVGLDENKALRGASRFSCTSISCITHAHIPLLEMATGSPSACLRSAPVTSVYNKALHRPGKRRLIPGGMS